MSTASDENEARYQAIVDTAVDAIAVIDEAGIISAFNPAAERLFGYKAQEALGQNVKMLMPEPDHSAHDGYLQRYRRTGERRIIGVGREVMGRKKNGDTFPLELSVAEWRAGGRRYFTGIMRDITERTKAEERQRLMVNELNHRVKNTLATVQAVAGQTLRSSQDLEQARTSLTERLLALAKGHDVLTRASWVGADLTDVVEAAVAAAERDRFQVSGPRARLTPKAALALSMTLHELFTNAVKFGALSTEDGQIEITWSRRRDDLTLSWREHGGPLVVPPERQGFGSRMIDALARDLDGVARIEFPPQGLVYSIRARLKPEPVGDAPLRGRRRA
ncbi:MAG TPA: PAS domain S-box protein [Caulobacteraceae bacterium]|nr:PAS domain S-box protein [Caulobacteraceae bacterium]